MTERLAQSVQGDTSQLDEQLASAISASERRRFLAKSGALAGSLATFGLAGRSLAQSAPGAEAVNLPPNVPEWSKKLGAPTASPYGKPSRFETQAIRNLYPGLVEPMSAYSTTPLQELDGIITPNGLFYERHHAGIPDVDPEQHRLMIHGMVKNPLTFTVDELRQFPS